MKKRYLSCEVSFFIVPLPAGEKWRIRSQERSTKVQKRRLTALRAEGGGIALGHTCGVRVDGTSSQGLWPPDGGRLCRRVVEKVLRIDGPFRAQGFLSLTGPLAPRAADCRSAAMLIKSALRDWLSVLYVTQYPVPPIFSFPLEGNASKRQRMYKAVHRFDTPSLS